MTRAKKSIGHAKTELIRNPGLFRVRCNSLVGAGSSSPSFFAKLVPGVDLVPFWTMAVANVYRKSKLTTVTIE